MACPFTTHPSAGINQYGKELRVDLLNLVPDEVESGGEGRAGQNRFLVLKKIRIVGRTDGRRVCIVQ